MPQRRTIFVSLGVLCVGACLIVVMNIGVSAYSKLFTKAIAAEQTHASSTSQDRTERGPVRMIRFTLMDEGIYPREIRVQHGLLNIAIEDKTHSTSGLVIQRITGSEESRVGEVKRFADHWRGRELIRLGPGRYRVFDASRPRNQSQLVVEP